MMARSTARSNQRPDTLMQDRKPTDRRKSLATHGRTIHCGLEIVNAVLTVGGVAFEKAGAHRVILRADPARARHGPSGGIGSRCKRSRTALASQSRCWEYWSVYELTHRAPGSRRAAGSRSTRTESPRICWHTIFICGKPQWYGKPLKQRGLLSRQADIRRVTGTSSVNLRHQARA